MSTTLLPPVVITGTLRPPPVVISTLGPAQSPTAPPIPGGGLSFDFSILGNSQYLALEFSTGVN